MIGDFPSAVPPPKVNRITIDAAEFTALKLIVMACVAHLANDTQASTGVPGQNWVNGLSVALQEAVLSSDILPGEDQQTADRFSAKVLKQINNILGAIRLSPVSKNESN